MAHGRFTYLFLALCFIALMVLLPGLAAAVVGFGPIVGPDPVVGCVPAVGPDAVVGFGLCVTPSTAAVLEDRSTGSAA